MGRLSIDLKEGFKNDLVVITVNGREAYRKANVSTRYQIGRADHVELDAAESSAVIEVTVPTQRASGRQEVDLDSRPYVGVWFTEDGQITIHSQEQPFLDM